MANIKDIADLAEVSVATVSNVLNNRGRVGEETRQKILKIIEEIDYKPNRVAKSLKMNKTHTIGVIVEDLSVFNAPEIIDGINEFAEENDYSILLTNLRLYKKYGNQFPDVDTCREMVMPLFHQLLSNQVEGIIYIGIHLRNVNGLLPDSSTPVVYTYCDTSDESDISINYDDYKASFDATSYLINKGYQEVALISGLINSESAHARFNGYCNALMSNGLQFNPNYVKTGDWEYESGYKMAMDLLKGEQRPSAILAMNDLMAGGVIKAASELNIHVPDELAIFGFDNREVSSYYTPKLSTVSLPLHDMGEISIKTLIDVIDGKTIKTKKRKLLCELIERDSS
ncbi:LacI family DNA-binding transcriptional regulator [Gracilibacillus salitolerans]|uniref:LacI family DNA-binding transcriptional regulator n=1 Tax=Gracilibacillus salitolerans TaxID=2663022 RepID=A0A5Q2TPP6_9BACI|nr:LacI family DNA-binding transcriptional regulator [Gracilibacillus salitolerans]QGH36092.1 LacI family DNA-binding transcriptional regulator [Gracilibacillus salitolerans]